MGFSSGQSRSWLFLSTVSKMNWNIECWFLWREENRRTWRKTFGTDENQSAEKLNLHLTPISGNEPRPQWCDVSTLTTAPFLLLFSYECVASYLEKRYLLFPTREFLRFLPKHQGNFSKQRLTGTVVLINRNQVLFINGSFT